EPLLHELNGSGRLLAVATGKSRRGLEHLIAKHDLRDVFVSLQTADGNASKPHPEMLLKALAAAGASSVEAAMIGDTTFDMEMAVAAGVAAVGVAWGHHSTDLLLRAGADHVVDDVAALRALLVP
ncbi:MAG: HAD-IA family hydrolase, partial [Pseudomonadota bacterium]